MNLYKRMDGASMWIVEQYGVQHHLLDPIEEDVFMWPHVMDGSLIHAFTTESCRTVLKRVTDTAKMWIHKINNADDVHVMPVFNGVGETKLYALVRITKSTSAISALLTPDHLENVDAMPMPDNVDYVASIPVNTYRLDEPQQFVIAVSTDKIVWTGWTLEEKSLQVQRAPNTATTLQINIHQNVFLFQRQSCMLSETATETMVRKLEWALTPVLPLDVIRIIASYICNSQTGITFQELQHDFACGVYNYATGRLIAIARHRGFANVPSLKVFGNMSVSEREKIYPIIKRTYRERDRVFSKDWNDKRTRSGRQY